MARKPTPETLPPTPVLPATGGAYELVDGELIAVPAPEEASEPAPETPTETGA